MRKGTIKVMVGANGEARIQEELNDEIKVYSQDAWQAELAKREAEDKKSDAKAEAEAKKEPAKKAPAKKAAKK